MPWDRTSRRRSELPADWPTIRTDVLNRGQHACRIAGPNCTRIATEVDHIGNRHNHSRTNLRAACTTCHSERTTSQRHDAMRALRATARHTDELHPALRPN